MNTEERINLEKEADELSKTLYNGMESLNADLEELERGIEKLMMMKTRLKDEKEQKAYIEYLKKEEELSEMQLEVARLEKYLEENPQELAESLEEKGRKIDEASERKETNCKVLNEKIESYEALGEEFNALRDAFQQQEEKIENLLWVKEQLELTASDPLNDSLF